MSTELLRASEAARRLEIPTKELLRLVHGRRIRFEMVDGIAHFLSATAGEHLRAVHDDGIGIGAADIDADAGADGVSHGPVPPSS